MVPYAIPICAVHVQLELHVSSYLSYIDKFLIGCLFTRRASTENLNPHPDSNRITHKSKSLDRHHNIQDYMQKRNSQKLPKKGMVNSDIAVFLLPRLRKRPWTPVDSAKETCKTMVDGQTLGNLVQCVY